MKKLIRAMGVVNLMALIVAIVALSVVLLMPTVAYANTAATVPASSPEQVCKESLDLTRALILVVSQSDSLEEALSSVTKLDSALQLRNSVLYSAIWKPIVRSVVDNAELIRSDPAGVWGQLRPQVFEHCNIVMRNII